MTGSERRRHVRLKPSVDVPVRVALLGDSLMREALDVVDISVGGMALTSPALRTTPPGARLKIQLSLGLKEEHTVEVVTRWTKADTIGVELVDAPANASQALSRYVAELLERGASA
jgi:c-di-GMP-binding flagellar brake protein YcgR